MFGFIIGAAALGLGMMAAKRRRHHFHRHGFGHRGGFRRRALHRVLGRLDTTPGQEKVILTAMDEFRDEARDAMKDLGDIRKQAADAFRAPDFDPTGFAALFDEPLRRLAALRDGFTKTVGSIHETLTPKQRDTLSDLASSTTRWGYGCAC